MTPRIFNKLILNTLDNCLSTLQRKGDEYATTTDRFHNFNVAARMIDTTPIKALAGMKLKHDVSVLDIINSQEGITKELIDEKIGDSINYLLLLKGMLYDTVENRND